MISITILSFLCYIIINIILNAINLKTLTVTAILIPSPIPILIVKLNVIPIVIAYL